MAYQVKPEDYKDVEYIIVDPSCSGSGMYRRTELNNDKVVPSINDLLFDQ